MKTRDDILTQLQDIMHELFELEADDITPDSHLYEDLDLDSIDAVDLVIKLQEITGKKLKPQEFKNVRTVSDVIDSVEKLAL